MDKTAETQALNGIDIIYLFEYNNYIGLGQEAYGALAIFLGAI